MKPMPWPELCLELNRVIMAAEGGIRSCPAFAGCYNEDLGTICYFNAGIPPDCSATGIGITELGATGLPMGLFSHATCDASLVALPPGAALCWFRVECWRANASARNRARPGKKRPATGRW